MITHAGLTGLLEMLRARRREGEALTENELWEVCVVLDEMTHAVELLENGASWSWARMMADCD